jgi:hypothetical protein
LKKQSGTFVHDQRDDGAGISTDSKEDVPLTDVDVTGNNKMCDPSVVLCKQGRSTQKFWFIWLCSWECRQEEVIPDVTQNGRDEDIFYATWKLHTPPAKKLEFFEAT